MNTAKASYPKLIFVVAFLLASLGLAGSYVSRSEASVSNSTTSRQWTRCAKQGGTCKFRGTMEVRYGRRGRYVYKVLKNGTACTNKVFGNPYPGTKKYCWIRAVSPRPAVAPTAVAPTTVAPTAVAPTTVAPTAVAPTTVAPVGSGARQPRAVPFSATSPFNTKLTSADQSFWFDVPVLRTVTIEGVTQQRNWYAGEGQLAIFHGGASDPLWTVTMPDFGVPPTALFPANPPGDTNTWNRWWPAATFTIRAPQNLGQADGAGVNDGKDHILSIIDETTGDYFEAWNGVVIDPVAHTITAPVGTGWARGNVDTGTGVGGYIKNGGTSAGVRAANFSWAAGAITGADIALVKSGQRDDFGHALTVMMGADLLSKWGVTAPATAPNPAWNDGPIKIGSRIGIPANVPRPSSLTDPLGIAYWNTLQRYGAFVGDFSGGSWPIFQVDIGSVPANTLNNIWIWWNDPYVTNPQNVANVLVIPHLRVMEAH